MRAPQVSFAPTDLQAYLNSVGQTFNVLADQNATQQWTASVAYNAVITLMSESGANVASNTVGLYNAALAAPPLYQIFPGAASPGWFVALSFRLAPTRLVVNLFDNNGALQGTSTYLGIDRDNFGVYINGPGGLFFSEDARNAGPAAQALAFAGTGVNKGSWWLAFEDTSANPASNYADLVLFLSAVNPAVPPGK